jgi:[CysO sulfur-carrier protein]-S-L-cysteine hydrolase
VKISRAILDQIIRQARAEAPNEACGYLAGSGESAKFAIPMRNTDASPEHYSFDPREQFAAVKRARAEGLDLVAVYHSHPATPARMSQEDIRLANDTSVLYLIYSMVEDRLKGFRVDRQKTVVDVPVEIAAGESQ